MKNSIIGLLAFLSVSLVAAHAAPTWTPKYVSTTVNGQVVPFGYYEYLPTSYNSGSPLSTYPLVIFLHGAGEYGDGTSTGSPGLSYVLGAGVPHFINSNTFPLAQSGGTLDTNNVLCFCPQHNSGNSPWAASQVRSFLNFALAAYPKIDRRRIWLTGLSYGSTGATSMMDITQDANPDDAAAVVACAWRGDDFGIVNGINTSLIGKVVPLWVLTSQGDTSSHPDDCVSNLATAIKGSSAPDTGIFPGGTFTQPYTAYFNGTSWTLSSLQVDPITGVNPKMTYFTGNDHNSWDRTYGNTNVWNWMFQQQKPDVIFSSPSTGVVVAQGGNITFTGSATDKNGTPITGTSLQWISSINGLLGTGASLTVNNLSVGFHTIKIQATDNSYRDNKAAINVTVPYTGAFTAQFDFSYNGAKTAGWNDINSYTSGSVANAVDATGKLIGISLAITQPFAGSSTVGNIVTTNTTVPPGSYPSVAQQGAFYLGSPSSSLTSQMVISGLNPAESYTFSFYSSRTGVNDDRTSTFTATGANTQTVTVNAANNMSMVSFSGAIPNSSGQIVLTVSKDSTSQYGGYLSVMTITTAGAPVSPLASFRTAAGLASDGSQDTATPGHDGVSNIMKYAFNMTTNNYADIATFNRQMLTANGTSGLPLIQTDGSGHLTITFVQRISSTNPGITYVPQVSSDLTGSWTALGGSPTTTTPIDSTWQRVTYTDTATTSSTARRFIRVQVTSP